ncbi:hypothetical protein [Bacillus sp. FJAT-44742]|nr:hypothetical protein [Bacillus sp. FJAT-44742]
MPGTLLICNVVVTIEWSELENPPSKRQPVPFTGLRQYSFKALKGTTV